MAEPPLRVVLVTTPPDAGSGIARALIEDRLVACVNMTPVRSVFRWEGRVEEESEQLLVMKTRADQLDALEARVRALHPYDCPEFIALEVIGGADDYLNWVAEEVRPCAE